MWSNFRFLLMTDVEKSEISPHLACGNCKMYAVLLSNWFYYNLRTFVAKSVLMHFTHFCVEKNLTKNCLRGEKMTNIRYECHHRRKKKTLNFHCHIGHMLDLNS